MKKIWILRQNGEDVINTANYFSFCSKVKKLMKTADEQATGELKNRIAGLDSDVICSMYRDAHVSAKNSFSVFSAEVDDESKDYLDYKNEQVNDGVLSYLWSQALKKK